MLTAGTPVKHPGLLLLLLLCSASMTFCWIHLHTDTGTNDPSLIKARALTDLYPRWYGAREVLLHHRDPYSHGVTQEIQSAYDGREQRFNYPLYVIVFLAPTIGMQFHSAQIFFWWMLVAVTASSLALWLWVIPLQLSLLARITLFVVVLTSVPVLQGLSLLQFGLLVAGLLTGAVAAAVAGHLFLAGMLLASATIKPPLSVLVIAWFLVWVIGDWRRRRSLVWGFAGTLAVLILASEYLLPGWVFRYPGVLTAYTKHGDATPLISMLLPPSVYWPVAISGLLATALFCWKVRRQPASSTRFVLAFALVSTLTVLNIPPAWSPYNHLLLLPAVLLILHQWTQLWSRSFLSRIVICLLAGMGILPWLLALVVTARSLMTTQAWLANIRLAPLYASLLLPFAVLGLLLLVAKSLRPFAATNLPLRPAASHTANT
jgi:hypothetical protein